MPLTSVALNKGCTVEEILLPCGLLVYSIVYLYILIFAVSRPTYINNHPDMDVSTLVRLYIIENQVNGFIEYVFCISVILLLVR